MPKLRMAKPLSNSVVAISRLVAVILAVAFVPLCAISSSSSGLLVAMVGALACSILWNMVALIHYALSKRHPEWRLIVVADILISSLMVIILSVLAHSIRAHAADFLASKKKDKLAFVILVTIGGLHITTFALSAALMLLIGSAQFGTGKSTDTLTEAPPTTFTLGLTGRNHNTILNSAMESEDLNLGPSMWMSVTTSSNTSPNAIPGGASTILDGNIQHNNVSVDTPLSITRGEAGNDPNCINEDSGISISSSLFTTQRGGGINPNYATHVIDVSVDLPSNLIQGGAETNPDCTVQAIELHVNSSSRTTRGASETIAIANIQVIDLSVVPGVDALPRYSTPDLESPPPYQSI